jgi:hypothetical protein
MYELTPLFHFQEYIQAKQERVFDRKKIFVFTDALTAGVPLKELASGTRGTPIPAGSL